MDRIVVEGIRFYGYHGCLPLEKEEGQEFLMDLEVDYDFTPAAEKDDLAEAVDYRGLVERACRLAARERFNLIETLAVRIAEELLQEGTVERVKVRIHKPHAPLGVSVADVAAEVERFRGGSGGGNMPTGPGGESRG